MHKSLIAALAAVASLALVAAILFVTSAPPAAEIASAVPKTEARAAEPDVHAPKLSVPEARDAADTARAAAHAETKATTIDPRAPLAPGAVRFCGRIAKPDGSPAAEARIGIFAVLAGEPVNKALAHGRSDATGAFCVDAQVSGESGASGELVLLACADGCLPLTLPLARASQPVNDLGALRLEEGAALSGRVLCQEKPLSRAEVAAVLDSPLENYALADRFVKWTHRRFVWAFAIADTTEDGRFAISGLEPETYQVRVSSFRGSQAVLGLQNSAHREVRAPAESVDFALDAATVTVNFKSDELALRGVEAQVHSGGAHLSAVSDESGSCTFKILPHLEFTLVAALANYKGAQLALTAPGAGELRAETVTLEASRPPATLFFDLVPPGNERVFRARFVFYGPDSSEEKPSFVKEVDLKSPQSTRVPHKDGPRDELEVDAIPPGFYRVVVQAGDLIGYASSLRGNVPYFTYCDAEIALSVPATGEIRRSLNLAPRASIQIAARDRSGHMLHAEAKLLDSTGAPIEMSLAVRRNGIWQSLTALDESDYTTARSTLCSGSALIELACKGFRSKRVPVTFESQRPLPIDVTLDAE